jgi:hypothetical protein
LPRRAEEGLAASAKQGPWAGVPRREREAGASPRARSRGRGRACLAASASPLLCSSPLRSLVRRPPELELVRAPSSVAKQGGPRPPELQLLTWSWPSWSSSSAGAGPWRGPAAELGNGSPWTPARGGGRARCGRPRGAPPPSSTSLFLRSTTVELAPSSSLLPRPPSAPSAREARAPPAASRRQGVHVLVQPGRATEEVERYDKACQAGVRGVEQRQCGRERKECQRRCKDHRGVRP